MPHISKFRTLSKLTEINIQSICFYQHGASYVRVLAVVVSIYVSLSVCQTPVLYHKNSSGDEIANVNFLTTISHTCRPTSKYRKKDKPTSFNKLDDR